MSGGKEHADRKGKGSGSEKTEPEKMESGRTGAGKPDFDELEFEELEFEGLKSDETQVGKLELEELELDEPKPGKAEPERSKPQESDLEKEDLEDWGEDEDWEEDQAVRPWMIAVILAGLLVLAAIICAILWNVTHSDRGNTDHSSGTEEDMTAGEPSASEENQPEGTGQPVQGADQDGQEGSQAQPEGAGQDGSQDQPEDPSQSGSSEQDGKDQSQISMSFTPVQESVTAKDATNLRSQPSTLDNETIVAQISNGEVITRTGINSDTGWSQVEYNGQTLYAVSQLLTTDLSYKPPVQPADPNRVVTAEGRVVIFTNCDDHVSPKMYVNLRREPSTAQGDDTIYCQITSEQTVHRTGWSEDAGWSRVEYDGQVLYVVTSFLNVVQAQ